MEGRLCRLCDGNDGLFHVAVAAAQDRTHHALPSLGRQPQIEKARARHLDLGHTGRCAQLGGERLGNVARLLARWLGQDHRCIRRHIAVAGIARRLHRHLARDCMPLLRFAQPAR